MTKKLSMSADQVRCQGGREAVAVRLPESEAATRGGSGFLRLGVSTCCSILAAELVKQYFSISFVPVASSVNSVSRCRLGR